MITNQNENRKFASILLFGPPGSGKGTIGQLLAMATNQIHLSSGNIFRSLSPDSTGGKLFHQYAHQGLLVPDDVTIEIWHQYVLGMIAVNWFFPSRSYLILDGVPRTANQVKLIDPYIDVRHIIFLNVTDKEELFKRLQGRAKIENRKDDLSKDVLEKRMEVYAKETEAVLKNYPQELISTINASQRPPEVLRDVLIKLASLLSRAP